MIFYRELKHYNNCKCKAYFSILMLSLFFFASSVFASAKPLYSFQTRSQSQQFDRITHQLRCLVCQNENLADSQANFASDMRGQIYKMVKNGFSDSEIKNYMVKRYGDFILYNPPFNKMTIFLWSTPILLLLIGIIIFFTMVYRKKP